MNLPKVLALLALITGFQSASMRADDLFRLTFQANCRSLDSLGLAVTSKISERSIVAQCLASNGVSRSLLRHYALVYNATSDRLQVSDFNGNILCDVIQFEGGAATSDTNRSDRFTFMFLPDQTTAFGSAFITERVPLVVNGTNTGHPRILGRVQFALTDDMALDGAALPSADSALPNAVVSSLLANSSSGLDITPADTNLLVTGTNSITPGATNGLALINPTNGITPSTPTNGFVSVIPSVTATNTSTVNQTNSSPTTAIALGSSPGGFITVRSLVGTNLPNVRICSGFFSGGAPLVSTGVSTNSVGTK